MSKMCVVMFGGARKKKRSVNSFIYILGGKELCINGSAMHHKVLLGENNDITSQSFVLFHIFTDECELVAFTSSLA